MKTRVLHVVPDLVPYGLERIVASLIGHRDGSRFDVSVASLYGELEGNIGASLERQGARVFYLGKKRGLDPRMVPRLACVIAEVRPRVLHTHNYVLRYALPAGLGRGIEAVVHTIHNVAGREVDRLGRWLQWWAFRHGVHPVAIAAEVAATFRQVYSLPEPTLIPNGIAVEDYRSGFETREAWRSREGFAAGDLLFTCVARFSEQKNHAMLLDAFASQNGRTHLLLAGDGELRSHLERRVDGLGLAGRVHFLGRREDVPAILAASDVFVLASLWEGNPLSVMEAMAAGLPAVVTAVGGVPELLKSGRHGFVVPPGNTADFASAMTMLAESPQLRQRMGAAAGAHASAHFDHRQMVAAYESLYTRLLRNEPKPGVEDGWETGAARGGGA